MEFLSPGNNMSNAQCMLIRACGLIMLNTVSCVRPQIRVLIKKIFFLFLIQTYVLGTQKNRLDGTVLMGTQNTLLN